MSSSREGGSRCKSVLAALSGMGLVNPLLAHCKEEGKRVLLRWCHVRPWVCALLLAPGMHFVYLYVNLCQLSGLSNVFI